MKEATDDALWELVDFSAREAFLLRAFLEYLNSGADPLDKKLLRLKNWKNEIGLELGNPELNDKALVAVRTARAAPPEVAEQVIRIILAAAHSVYFGH